AKRIHQTSTATRKETIMNTNEPAVTVSEASMQEWAMLAFQAERAPKRVQVTIKKAHAIAEDDRAVGGARTRFWIALAAATAGMAWLLV
ncbi:MAG: hypothetical protein ACREBN_07200, partial [Burkholderiaceae bacterium]